MKDVPRSSYTHSPLTYMTPQEEQNHTSGKALEPSSLLDHLLRSNGTEDMQKKEKRTEPLGVTMTEEVC